jgi:hypothetical protein
MTNAPWGILNELKISLDSSLSGKREHQPRPATQQDMEGMTTFSDLLLVEIMGKVNRISNSC